MKAKGKPTQKPPLGAFDPREFGPGFDRGEAFSLDKLMEYFNEKGNPVYLWVVRAFCRRNNCPVPERIEQYLDEVGDRLIDLVYTERPIDDVAKEVYKALDPSKRSNWTLFRRYEKNQRNFFAAGLVAGLIYERKQRGEKPKVTEVINEVADAMGMSPENVSKAYYE